ncbi:hypothetical protein CGQ36_11520 [Nocardiopsis dassonvillei]|nr:hypothetical protein CGQ36_11520 [Nocardiopsis dassonvillei]
MRPSRSPASTSRWTPKHSSGSSADTDDPGAGRSDAHRRHGGELTRIAVETTAPIGGFTGWTPARTVTQWCLAVLP